MKENAAEGFCDERSRTGAPPRRRRDAANVPECYRLPVARKNSGIQWRYEEIENGARVVAVTNDPEALSAIREFPGFQIADHRTDDPDPLKGCS